MPRLSFMSVFLVGVELCQKRYSKIRDEMVVILNFWKLTTSPSGTIPVPYQKSRYDPLTKE